MPSLRRTNSSPAVRSSPYRAPLTSCSTQTRTGARSPRRSSGSDTTNRRVLADLDWWRVEEGQREVRGLAPHEQLRPATPSTDDDELDQEEREPLPAPRLLDFAPAGDNVGAAPVWHSMPGGGLNTLDTLQSRLTTWSAGEVDLSDPSESPSAWQQLSALSLNPVGRATLQRSDSMSSAFSDASSSSESSFSSPVLSPVGIDFGFSDVVDGPAVDSDDENDAPSYGVFGRGARRPARAPMRSVRSVSYSFIEDQLTSTRAHRDVFDDDWSTPSPFSNSSFNSEDDPFF